jgi:hypothetical protein
VYVVLLHALSRHDEQVVGMQVVGMLVVGMLVVLLYVWVGVVLLLNQVVFVYVLVADVVEVVYEQVQVLHKMIVRREVF